MAIYMCSVKVIKRSEGKSVVAAAAYRSGEVIENLWDGVTHNYTNKHWIEHTEVMLPEHAPKEYLSRSTLWNAVEMSEKSSTARLGKEVLLALPREMSLDEQIALVQDYTKRTFVDDGMCADISIHNPPLRNDLGQPIDYDNHVLTDSEKYIYPNPHAHILLTMRPIDKNGKWEGKSSIEYICKLDGIEKALTAEEFKKYQSLGWEKQYKYMDGDKKRWMTTSEGKKLGLTRAGKNPKTSTHGRPHPTVARWESPKTIYHWRKSWEEIANEHLQRNGYSERIDSRSYANQGRTDYIPTIHLGSNLTNMLRREARIHGAIPTEHLPDIVRTNREIENHNMLVAKLTKDIDNLTEKINGLTNDACHKIDMLKEKLSEKQKEKGNLDKQILKNKYELIRLQNSISLLNDASGKIRKANVESAQKINKYTSELQSLSCFEKKRKFELEEKISHESKSITWRNHYLSNMLGNYNLSSIHDINRLMSEYTDADAEAKELNNKLAACMKELEKIAINYTKLITFFAENKIEQSLVFKSTKNR